MRIALRSSCVHLEASLCQGEVRPHTSFCLVAPYPSFIPSPQSLQPISINDGLLNDGVIPAKYNATINLAIKGSFILPVWRKGTHREPAS